MSNQKYDLHDVKKDLNDVKETQETIIKCLRGDAKKHKDEGLIGDVNKNTDWRKLAKYWFGAITLIVISALIRYIVGLL